MSSDFNISVGYNPINKSNTFISGDYITGKITLDVKKECKIESLCIKLKGKAEVKWTEHYGRTIVTYHKKEKYFSIKQDVIQANQGNNIVGQGCHVYPFTFQIPAQDLPSSFKGSHGKIRYTLEANLSRSMRMDSKAKAEFTLIYNGNLNSDPLVMAPQHQATDKKMKLFTSGTVGMDVNIARTGFHQGGGIQVVASIQNRSSREIKPKYCLYKKYSYFAKGKRKLETKDILKEVGEPIPPSAGQTVTRTITIPPDTCVSILNCQIIKAEYRLRVYLDVKYASDPQIKFPIVILPALPGPEGEQQPAYPGYGFGVFANSDLQGGNNFQHFPPTTGPSAPPPPYGIYEMYPSLAVFDKKPSKSISITRLGHTHPVTAVPPPSSLPVSFWVAYTMSTTVKSLKVSYNSINEKNTFTSGDMVSGQVTLEVAKDCQIESLMVQFKGKSEVLWTERHGQVTVVYHSKDKYFSIKHYFIRDENAKGEDNETLLTHHNGDTYSNVVAPGCHVYPFTFHVPFQNMPSSFKGSVGKITYTLKAVLSRSMRVNQKDKTNINYVSNVDISSDPVLMTPQHEAKDKKMKFFTSGSVAMDVNLEKTGFFQGEGIQVMACIENNSSREIKPKYCLYRKHSFFANGQRRVSTKDLLKEVGEPIPASTNVKVSKVIAIPHDAEPSILHCSNITAEYRLRVYLDVKYASDPEIKFPIVILPASLVPAVAPAPAASAFGFEPFANPSPPAWGSVPTQQPAAHQSADPPPSYGAYGMYPPLTDFGKVYQRPT
ncbi:uncharacterized protein LKV04_001850 [Tautogolabrus adspersus]